MDRLSSFRWRPTTTALLIGGFGLILVALVASFVVANFKPTTTVHIGSGVYNLWLADTEPERVTGLSGVESIAINGGMLFVFDSDNTWGIWMKDMKIPLDIIWLDAGKKVVYIRENVSPDTGVNVTYAPKTPSRYVLELKAGSVKKAGIKVGQTARFTVEGEPQ